MASLNEEDDHDNGRHDQGQPEHAQQPAAGKALHSKALTRTKSTKQEPPNVEDWLEKAEHITEEARILEGEDVAQLCTNLAVCSQRQRRRQNVREDRAGKQQGEWWST